MVNLRQGTAEASGARKKAIEKENKAGCTESERTEGVLGSNEEARIAASERAMRDQLAQLQAERVGPVGRRKDERRTKRGELAGEVREKASGDQKARSCEH
eukprot:2841111-Pleurochrysis_carterae.AAC.1